MTFHFSFGCKTVPARIYGFVRGKSVATVKTGNDGYILRIGLNYRFGAPFTSPRNQL